MKPYLLFFIILFPLKSWSFLENATHGYANCLTCHYSPAGGNLLNEYGRTLSSELMSTWTQPGAERAFGGLVKETEWMKIGGDSRAIQRYVDNSIVEDREFFLMQNNIEVGLKYKSLMAVGSIGVREGPDGFQNRGEFLSERHFLLADLSDTSRLRAGKFRRNYGITDPNHNRLIKRGLGFGSNSETYNLEYTKFFDDSELSLTYSLGRIDRTRRAQDERSLSSKYSKYFGGNYRIGASALVGQSQNEDRVLVGAHGIAPITEKTYLIYEADYESAKNNFSKEKEETVLSHLRLGYEVVKGLKSYLIYEQTNVLSDSENTVTAPGLGFQWLPFPHFELQVEYQALNRKSIDDTTHFGFVVFHIYY